MENEKEKFTSQGMIRGLTFMVMNLHSFMLASKTIEPNLMKETYENLSQYLSESFEPADNEAARFLRHYFSDSFFNKANQG